VAARDLRTTRTPFVWVIAARHASPFPFKGKVRMGMGLCPRKGKVSKETYPIPTLALPLKGRVARRDTNRRLTAEGCSMAMRIGGIERIRGVGVAPIRDLDGGPPGEAMARTLNR